MASADGDIKSSETVADVLIDSVGLSRTYSYSVPGRYLERLGIGSYVTVPLGSSRSKGWVVGLRAPSSSAAEEVGYELSPIFRLLGGGPTAEVIGLCKWAAWRFAGSPVNFLTHASPKKRIPSNYGGELDFESCSDNFRSCRGQSLVVRIPPSHSRSAWIAGHIGEPSQMAGQVLVVCPTLQVVDDISSSLTERGFEIARFPEQFEKARDVAQVVIGARTAVFASLTQLVEIIIVDADDPSHTETSSPSWSSYLVARARVSENQRAVLLSSAPTVEMSVGANTMALSRSEERSGWPKVMIGDISEDRGPNALLPSPLITLIGDALSLGVKEPALRASGLIEFDGVIVLYNRLGGARSLVCGQCGKRVECVTCGTALTQASDDFQPGVADRGDLFGGVKKRLVVAGLFCPRCRQQYPTICTGCLSTSLKVVGFGVARFRALLEAAVRRPVNEVDAGSELAPGKLGPIVVGTEAVFSRFRSAKLVVIADFDQYLYSQRFDANEVAMSLLARAARLVKPRGLAGRMVPLYIQTRDVENTVAKAAVEGDPRKVLKEEALVRRRFNLPPFGGLVRVHGPKASRWLERSGVRTHENVTLTEIDGGVFDLRSHSLASLLDILAQAKRDVSASGVKFSVTAG